MSSDSSKTARLSKNGHANLMHGFTISGKNAKVCASDYSDSMEYNFSVLNKLYSAF